MVTAFWSPNHGQTGTTTTALTLAAMTAITNNYKLLIGHSQFERSTLERCLIPKKHGGASELIAFKDHGMDALRRLAKNGRLMPEKVSDYTTSLLGGNRLDLLQGSKDMKDVGSEDETTVLRRIFAGAKNAYDLVMIDVHSGSNHRLTQMLLEDADLVVVCLNQNRWLLDDFFLEDGGRHVLEGKKLIYHISNYSSESKYTIKNIKKLYGLETVIATPYSQALMDACSGGLALDFFMRHIGCSKKDRFWPLVHQVSASTETFLSVLGQMDKGLEVMGG